MECENDSDTPEGKKKRNIRQRRMNLSGWPRSSGSWQEPSGDSIVCKQRACAMYVLARQIPDRRLPGVSRRPRNRREGVHRGRRGRHEDIRRAIAVSFRLRDIRLALVLLGLSQSSSGMPAPSLGRNWCRVWHHGRLHSRRGVAVGASSNSRWRRRCRARLIAEVREDRRHDTEEHVSDGVGAGWGRRLRHVLLPGLRGGANRCRARDSGCDEAGVPVVFVGEGRNRVHGIPAPISDRASPFAPFR